ncbi:acetyl-CoA hydrolase/transferase C-terminal domain-containing protein [Neobacillus drentensis]|uniref:acetyl-CoA hydrolase/transferase C-terminal domain-containing protein n=1 Tax=Neobacillus drentensis TaxID=220684 RepID=UPI002FFEF3EF
MVVGEIGNGWKQSMAELAYERSGPKRFLSTFPLLIELIRVLQQVELNERHTIALGGLVTRLITLREMSLGVAGLLEKGITPEVTAALVKDLGTQFEREIAEVARTLVSVSPLLPSRFVTEYGVADLRNKSMQDRAEAIIQVAAPSFRSELEAAWHEHKSLWKWKI